MSHGPMRAIREGEDHTICGARGCGGLILYVEAYVDDGAIHYCGACGREHTYHVIDEGGPLYRSMERKPRPKKKRDRGATP